LPKVNNASIGTASNPDNALGGRDPFLDGSNAAPLAAGLPRRYPPRAMSVSSQQVRHIAKLARIGMSDAEIEAMVPEINNILGWVEQLGEVDTDGIEPLATVVDQKMRLRDDVVDAGNIRDEVLANAPEAQHGFFAVPKVIE
jgi:aspartyl-tRNA(Asn)/glutamyl-tRNA(Gln) amidotransferase subunit C